MTHNIEEWLAVGGLRRDVGSRQVRNSIYADSTFYILPKNTQVIRCLI